MSFTAENSAGAVSSIAFIGFGELGAALASAFDARNAYVLRAWTRRKADRASAVALDNRLRTAKVKRSLSLRAAIEGADAILCVVPGSASREIAERGARWMGAGTLYVDLTAAAISDKRIGGAAIERAGGHYVDAAVLGTAAVAGAEVPVLASGPAAEQWCELAGDAGLSVQIIDGGAGAATRLKLVRSVYMKGRDALIVETLLAARRYGIADEVAESIAGSGEQVPFAQLADRVLRSLALHSERRADELRLAADVVQAAGVEPRLANAAAAVLGDVAATGLRELFGATRPASGTEVLARLDERVLDKTT